MARPSVRLLPVLALLALVTSLLCGLPGPRAYAGTVSRQQCARYDAGVRAGVCVRDQRGGLYWLGTLRGYDGVEMYCIDYLYATRWGVAHRRVKLAGPLPTSLGRTVGAQTRAALTYVVTRSPAATADDTTAAAIGLIIREVMGDVRGSGGQSIPGGLTAGTDVRGPSFVPAAIVRRARALWAEARAHRGPWTVQVRVLPGKHGRVEPRERVRMTVHGRNGSGRAQDMTVALSYSGFTGPRTVRLGADGAAVVTLTAPAEPRTAKVSARVAVAPSPEPVLIRPTRWHVNPHPGSSSALSQRGLVGQQATVVAADQVVVEVHYGPAVVTTTSQAEAVPGAALVDQVRLTGADPAYVGPVTATLVGPFTTPPGPDDCTGAAIAGTVRLPVHGDGTYTTPAVRVRDVGYYTWVESLPGTASQDAVRTPCGVAAETTLVTARPQIRTRTSAALVRVGAEILDRVQVGGTAPGYAARATARLYGPFPSLAAATCAGTPYATVGFAVSGDGDYVTPKVRLTAAGVYTWVESLPGDDLTRAATTGCGLVAETTTARRTPPVPRHPSVPAGGVGRGRR